MILRPRSSPLIRRNGLGVWSILQFPTSTSAGPSVVDLKHREGILLLVRAISHLRFSRNSLAIIPLLSLFLVGSFHYILDVAASLSLSISRGISRVLELAKRPNFFPVEM